MKGLCYTATETPVTKQVEEPKDADWGLKLYCDSAISLWPVLAITLGLPAIGAWALYFSFDASLRDSLCLGWTALLLAVVVYSSLHLPTPAVKYRSFLSRRGAIVRRSALAVSAIYAVTFGVFFTAVLRKLVQADATFLLPFIGYFTYCILVSSWFVKMPFDVEIKVREDAAKKTSPTTPTDK